MPNVEEKTTTIERSSLRRQSRLSLSLSSVFYLLRESLKRSLRRRLKRSGQLQGAVQLINCSKWPATYLLYNRGRPSVVCYSAIHVQQR